MNKPLRVIGLLGGMSFEASALYYRLINEAIRQRLGGLYSADIILRSVNFDIIARMQTEGRWDDAGQYLADAAIGLERAGAQCILLCTNTMHLVANAIDNATQAPLIHIIDETARVLRDAQCRRPLLVATRYTMEQGFYQARMARHDIDVMVPDEAGRAATHAIIFDELCQGKILDPSRDHLTGLIETAKAQGADSVILGCTEIGLILDPAALPLPGFDSTVIHAQAAVDFAMSA